MQTFLQKVINTLFFSSILNLSLSQVNFYQDIYKGGVCFAGFSTGLGAGNGAFDTYIESGSVIRKVFLFYQKHEMGSFSAPDVNVILDGTNLQLSNNNKITGPFREHQSYANYFGSVHFLDITNEYIDISTHSVNIPQQVNGGEGSFYGNIGLVILYENLLLPVVNVSLLINDQNLDVEENYYSVTLNSINLTYPVCFTIYSDIIANTSFGDGTNVFIENNFIGLIQGPDQNNTSWGYGTRGHFYYQNNQLFGLDDDTPDNLMNNSDALADVSSYLTSSNSVNWKMEWQNTNVVQNVYGGFIFAYSTPCDTFSVSVTPDTSICKGQNLQLSASGGQQYLWQSSSNSALGELSCIDCPNPIFSGDSSRLFTVQIWNNDSCSVVRPVKVNVIEKPKFSSINLVPTLCGLETGTSQAVALNTSVLPISYAIDNNAYDFSSTFTSSVYSALDSGYYTIHLKDGNGCVSDSTVFVGVNNPTKASFTANPQTGAAPLFVSLENTSVSATDYAWFLNDVQQNSSFSSFIADTSGVYEIELIAWQNDESCADTFTVFVSVYDSLLLQIPNIFTPNADGINDIFGITSNIPIAVKYEIYNRWGEVITYGTKEWSTSIAGGFYELWGGYITRPFFALASDGVYFYKMEISLLNDLFLPAVDLGQQKLEFPMKEEGFFHLEK